jgi:hypothetical protein
MQCLGAMLHAYACCMRGMRWRLLQLLLLLLQLLLLLLREPCLELRKLTQALLQCCNS